MKKAAENTRETQRAIKTLNNNINHLKQSAASSFSSVAQGAVGMAAAIVSIGTVGKTVSTAFGEAMSMEGFRMQLETATKDTAKAAEIMKWAVDLANKTPFETGHVVEASARLEAMSMSAKKFLPVIGDMAGATNKELMQATEALIDAQTGELERLKEFGITKAMIVKQAYEKMGKIQVVNNKGQITDQEKFNEALLSLMSEKFAGGMEKQASTFKGLWSTVTGVTKSALANMVGMTADGTIQQGSLMETLKGKVKSFGDTLTRMQGDGTFQKIGDSVNQGLATAKTIFMEIGDAIKWTKENADWLVPVLIGVTTAIVAQKVVTLVTAGWKHYNTVTKLAIAQQGLLNTVMAASPIGWIAIAIGVAVAAGILLYKNWDTISKFLQETWQKTYDKASAIFNDLKSYFTQLAIDIKTTLVTKFEETRTALVDAFTTIGNKATEIWDKVDTTVYVIAGTITGLFLPALIKMGVTATIEAAKVVTSFVIMEAKALWTATVYAVQVAPMVIASFISMGIQSTINAAKVVGSWILMGVQATINAIKVIGSWIAMGAQAIATGIVYSIQAAIIVGSWVWMGIQSMIQAVRMAAAWVIAMGPIAWVSALIVGLVILVIANWETVRNKTIEIWSATTEWLSGVWSSISSTVSDVFSGIGSTISGIWDGIVSGIKGSINSVIGAINFLIKGMNKVKFDIPDWVPGGAKSFGLNIPEIPSFAVGTSYFKGGLARTDEHGGEIKEYPNGTKVIPHDVSVQMAKGMSGGVTVNLYISGDVVGDTTFANRIGEYLFNQLKSTHSNLA